MGSDENLYSDEDLTKKASEFFTSSQWQRLNFFFEQQGDTVYNIFKNTTTASGVMVLFIVFNGLSKDIRDIVVNSAHVFKKNILLPSSFDNILLKKYRKLCTSGEYILKCKYCDFISYMSYTMEHMAFVHDRHFGFGLKTPSQKDATNGAANNNADTDQINAQHTASRRCYSSFTSNCIFQTPNSASRHLFRDHFKPLINYRYKQLDVQFNDPNNLLANCYKTYLEYIESTGKLYTIENCTHKKQFNKGVYCSCIKMSMLFYQRFHNELYELLNSVNLTNWREGRFEAIGYIRPQKLENPEGDNVSLSKRIKYQKLRKHTRKSNISQEFEERIVKVYFDFFVKESTDEVSITDLPTTILDISDDSNEPICVVEKTSNTDAATTTSNTSDVTSSTMTFSSATTAASTSNIFSSIYQQSNLQNTLINPFQNLYSTNPVYYVILSEDSNKAHDAFKLEEKFAIPVTGNATQPPQPSGSPILILDNSINTSPDTAVTEMETTVQSRTTSPLPQVQKTPQDDNTNRSQPVSTPPVRFSSNKYNTRSSANRLNSQKVFNPYTTNIRKRSNTQNTRTTKKSTSLSLDTYETPKRSRLSLDDTTRNVGIFGLPKLKTLKRQLSTQSYDSKQNINLSTASDNKIEENDDKTSASSLIITTIHDQPKSESDEQPKSETDKVKAATNVQNITSYDAANTVSDQTETINTKEDVPNVFREIQTVFGKWFFFIILIQLILLFFLCRVDIFR